MVVLTRQQLCWSQKNDSTNTGYSLPRRGATEFCGVQVPKLMTWLLLPFINSKADL